MKKISKIIILSLLIISCSSPEKNVVEQKDTIKIDSTVKNIVQEEPAAPLLPYALRIGKNKKVLDTLDKINISEILSLLNSPTKFPEGLACLQGRLEEKVIIVCSTYKFRFPSLSISKPSLFTKDNVKDIFVFLTLVDSNRLQCSDYNYSFIRFLRYKTFLEDRSFSVKDGKEEHLNIVDYRKIIWNKPIRMTLYDEKGIYPTSFSEWKEIWSCSERYDYSPAHPFINISPTALVKPVPEDKRENWAYKYYSHPEFVFSVIKLQDDRPHVLDKIEKCSAYDTILTDQKSKAKCVDLNLDRVPDVLWYTDYYNNGNYSMTYLYLNVNGQWVPVWYRYYDVNK